jgi:alpha-amylase
VKGFFGNGTRLFDTYSGTEVEVVNGAVTLENNYDTALLELAD